MRWDSYIGAPTLKAGEHSRSLIRFRKCCSASTSVGAINADCFGSCPTTTDSIAAIATTVLPDPTSPWISRAIGSPDSMSARTVLKVSCWSPVSVKLRLDTKPSTADLLGFSDVPAAPRFHWSRRRNATSWLYRHSSNAMRLRAAARSARLLGACR